MRKVLKKILSHGITFIIAAIIFTVIGVVAATSISSAQVTYTGNSQSTVEGALNDLYTKTGKDFSVGDYISMTPTKSTYKVPMTLTGYTADQNITPNELTLWRVIKVYDDKRVDVVSEYTSSTGVYFKGATGYANYVGVLNQIAKSYENNKYTTGSRMMGYDGQTEYITNTSSFDGSSTTAPSTTTTPDPTSGTGQEYSGGVTGDTLYLTDYVLVSNVYSSDTTTYGSTGLKAYNVSATNTVQTYWLASRKFYYSSATSFNFRSRYVNDSGSLDYRILRRYYSSSWDDYGYMSRVRPILTLRSRLQVSSGSGTKASPYVLN